MIDRLAPTVSELDAARAWWDEHLAGDAWPFSCSIDGRRVDSPTGWTVERTPRVRDDGCSELTLMAHHPDHGLTLRCVAVIYQDFPVVEWTVHLEQTADGAAPLVTDLLGLDAAWRLAAGQRCFLRSWMGDDHELRTIYQPDEWEMRSGHRRAFAPTSRSGLDPDGRASSGTFPYFAFERAVLKACNERTIADGLLLAIGWPGRWSAEFALEGSSLRIRAGQERTRFRLRPGESFRTPLTALCFFQGDDRARSMNLWRRWMLAHNLPRESGKLPAPTLLGSGSVVFEEMCRATEENQIGFIDGYLRARLPITHVWMDAGWYPCRLQKQGGNAWPLVGTWEVDRTRFPRGLRPVTDHAHRQGLKTLLWFEPERVAPGSWLHAERQPWLLGREDQRALAPTAAPRDSDDLWRGSWMLDLGRPEVRAWVVERVSTILTEEGIDVYRQDFNFNPLPHWRANDTPGREGVTENHHTAGYLAWWDALRARFPGMLLDACASGGRRNDLETMRRAVALHPSDHRYDDLEAKQCLRHTLFQWIPFFGGPVLPFDHVDAYAFRSTMGLSTSLPYDLAQPLDLDLLRKLTAEWTEVAALFYGDYYPLTRWSLAEDAWMAWQFHRPEQGDGLIQVFRRRDSPIESACFPLHGLDPEAEYRFHDYDVPADDIHRGADLAEGWRIAIPERRTARLIRYQRA